MLAVDSTARLVFEPFAGLLVGEEGRRREALAFAAAAFPLIVGDIYGDAVKIGGKHGVATEIGKCAIQTQENLLREVFHMSARAGKAGERTEDSSLMFTHKAGKAFRRGPIAGYPGCSGEAHRLKWDVTAAETESFIYLAETFGWSGGHRK